VLAPRSDHTRTSWSPAWCRTTTWRSSTSPHVEDRPAAVVRDRSQYRLLALHEHGDTLDRSEQRFKSEREYVVCQH